MRHFVLITGASEGLGKAFAIESAKRGMDLLLVSLPGSGLPDLCELIQSNFDIFVDFLELDLTEEESCLQIQKHVKKNKYPISFLINNAGVGGDYHFASEGFEIFDRMIQLNIKALTMVTHQMLDIMKNQKEAFILNVSSMAANFEGPYKQVYGATKSYIFYFSKSLAQEMKNTNVHISVLSPGGISSNINHIRRSQHLDPFSKLTFLDPEFVAAYGIENCLQKKVEIIPGKLTKGYFLLSKMLPQFIREKLVNKSSTQMYNSRTITHRKAENGKLRKEILAESRVKNLL